VIVRFVDIDGIIDRFVDIDGIIDHHCSNLKLKKKKNQQHCTF